MDFNITTLMKAMIGGAGLGFALTGGLSMLIPAFVVTDSIACGSAIIGAIALAATYVGKKLVA